MPDYRLLMEQGKQVVFEDEKEFSDLWKQFLGQDIIEMEGELVDGDDVERIDLRQVETRGAGRAHALARAAQRLQHRDPRLAEPGTGEQRRDRRRRRAVGGERQDARAGKEVRTQEVERPRVQCQGRHLRQRPAEARRRQAEGGGRRHDAHLGSGHRAGE